MRTVLLGLLGLVLAVTVGLGVHLITRNTISLPVVQLEPAPALAPPAATTGETTERTETEPRTETDAPPPPPTGAATETDDSGSGGGHGRSGGDSGGRGSGSGSDD